MSRVNVLKSYLKKNRQYQPTFSNGKLTNHLSMALIALYYLNADINRLHDFFEKYTKHLVPLSKSTAPSEIITQNNWEDHLGQDSYYQAYLVYFEDRINNSNISATLFEYLDTLIKGIASDAFHCLIRLAYAVDINDKDETAAALAYFASRYTPLNIEYTTDSQCNDPEKMLKNIRNNYNLRDIQFNDYTLIDRFLKVKSTPEFTSTINRLEISENTLHDCATLAIQLYASTKNFTALHIVTATNALRILLQYTLNKNQCLQYYWQAFCIAYVSIGSPLINSNTIEKSDATWQEIFLKVIHSDDDHVIKMVYSCYKEEQYYKNPVYKYVANMIANK